MDRQIEKTALNGLSIEVKQDDRYIYVRPIVLDIHDLVDFVISKCNKDIFCLFEVYTPDGEDEEKRTWVPYITRGFRNTTAEGSGGDYLAGNIYGIYDPWLY